MSSAFYIFTSVVNLFISAMLLLMLIRAILSWLPINDEHPIVEFLYAVTEFVVAPVRALLYHFEWIPEFSHGYFVSGCLSDFNDHTGCAAECNLTGLTPAGVLFWNAVAVLKMT